MNWARAIVTKKLEQVIIPVAWRFEEIFLVIILWRFKKKKSNDKRSPRVKRRPVRNCSQNVSLINQIHIRDVYAQIKAELFGDFFSQKGYKYIKLNSSQCQVQIWVLNNYEP